MERIIGKQKANKLLMDGVLAKDSSLVLEAIKKGANIECADKEGQTPLMFAASKGPLKIARLLLEKGADIEAMNIDGLTPLMFAAMGSRAQMTELLLEKGANVNETDNIGLTPLMHAIINSRRRSAMAIIRAGADLNATTKEGRNAMYYSPTPAFYFSLLDHSNAILEDSQKESIDRANAVSEIIDGLEKDLRK